MRSSPHAHASHLLPLQWCRYRDELAKVGPDFTAGFVTAMEGEKDPRCLLTCLRLAGAILEAFGPRIDEFVEVSSVARWKSGRGLAWQLVVAHGSGHQLVARA